MSPHITNWVVRTYDRYGKQKSEFIIKDRTENEAVKEAEAEVNEFYDDWTMEEII